MARGAPVLREPYGTDDRFLECLLLDSEGNRWSFGTYGLRRAPA